MAGGDGTRPLRRRAAARAPRQPAEELRRAAPRRQFIEWSHVIDRLRAAEGYWIGTVTPGNRPHVVPIWGCFVGDDLYLETGAPDTIKNRNLASNQNVFVHLDDVNDVVIIRGMAVEIRPDPELGEGLAAAMGGKYKDYDPTPDSWDEAVCGGSIPNRCSPGRRCRQRPAGGSPDEGPRSAQQQIDLHRGVAGSR